MEPNPDPDDSMADLLSDPGAAASPRASDPGAEDQKKESSQTKDPGQVQEPIDGGMNPEPEATVTVTAGPAPVSDSSDGMGPMIPWVLVVLLLAAVVALAVKAFGRGNRPAPAPVPVAPVSASVPVVAPAADPSASPVVPELITLADLITTPAAQTQVVRTLRTVGVEPVEATVGAPFNPDLHEAVATRPAQAPGQPGTIAVVHRTGWRSARGVVRPAGVEVWTADTSEGA